MTILGIAAAAGWILYLSSPASKGTESTTSVERQPFQTNEQSSELKTQFDLLTADQESLIQENLALRTLNEALNEAQEATEEDSQAHQKALEMVKNLKETADNLQDERTQMLAKVDHLTVQLRDLSQLASPTETAVSDTTTVGESTLEQTVQTETAETTIQTQPEETSELAASLDELNGEMVASLKESVSSLQNERLQLLAKVDQLEQVLEVSNDTMDDLQPATDSGSEVLEVADTSIESTGAEAESTQADQQELELVKNLKESVDNLQNERQQLLVQVDQLEKIQEEGAIRFSEQLDKNNAELKKALQEQQGQSEKIVQLTERLKQVLEMSNDTMEDLQPATDSGSEVSEVADTSIESTGAEAESTQADQQELELVKNLKESVDNLQNERQQLLVQVDQLEKIQEEGAIRFSEQLDKNNAELKKALQEQQGQSEKIVQLTERLKQVLEMSNDTMEDLQPATDSGSEVSEVADTSMETSSAEAVAESSQAGHQALNLEQTVKNLNQSVSSLQDERFQLLAKVDHLTTQLKKLSQSASQTETAVSDTKTGESAPEQTAQTETAETTAQTSSEETSELAASLDELNSKVLASLKESVSGLQNQLQATQNEVDRLALQLDSSERRARYLNIRLRYASKHLRRHRAKMRETETKSENLVMERQELQENLSKLSSTLNQSITEKNQSITENKTEMALLVSKFSVIRLESDVIFDSGSAKLSTQGLETLRDIAHKYQDYPDRIMSIEGHTDNKLIAGNLARIYPTNWELSAARAAAATHFLTQQGVPEDKLRIVGFGALQPIASNDTEEGRATNRRIEIRLAPKLSEAETN